MLEHRADHIIRTARSRTGNSDYGPRQGVPQREFVAFLNDAQKRVYNKILQEHSTLYQKQVLLDVTAGTAAVALPTGDVFLSHNIVSVHYAQDGNPVNFCPLELRSVRQEIATRAYPGAYFLMGSSIMLSPIPSTSATGALKVTYQYTIPDLDIRRAKIASSSGVLPAVTSVTLTDDTTLLSETETDLAAGWVDYVSFVDKDGTILAKGKPVVSYNSSTKVLTLNTTLSSGETLPKNCYLVFGKNATTNSWLPDIAERFLTEYTVLRAQMRDSNREAVDTSPLLAEIEKDILAAVGELEEDVSYVPILSYDYLYYAEGL